MSSYLENKRYGDATDVFSRILVSVPNDFVAQVGMSIIRDEENKLNDAIWHMERAFETQPSNSAIQGELQRLYGRRDGVQPPRIRMTRGALAHMYVQGELYPQAISEIKSVLKEDPERSDMQALLARACYKSGAKNDAVDAALILLQRYPYSFDANRVLVEVLNADRNENAQAYRQRVIELDPYAAQVTGSIFQSNEVSDAAVSIERLDWNGQPVGMQSNWRESKAIGLESGLPSNEQPAWMKSSFAETNPPALPQSTSASMFEESTPSAMTPAQPAEDIPDFLKVAGWGESTGTFDESKSIFADEEPATPAAQSIEQGDLPDWVKAMAPQAPVQNEEKEEELPDWINKIGPAGALSSEVSVQPDWMSQLDEPSTSTSPETNDPLGWLNDVSQPEPATAQPAGDQPDWLAGLDSGSDFTPQAAQTDVPDWMKEASDETPATSAAQGDVPAWMSGLGSEAQAIPASPSDMPDWAKEPADEASSMPSAQTDVPDWMNELSETSSVSSAQIDAPDWMSGLGNETPATPTSPSDMPDWAKELANESPSLPAAQPDLPDWTSGLESETQATLSASQADIPDWVRGLGDETPATPSGAADQPDWMKGFSEATESTPSVQADESDWLNQVGTPSESTPAVSASNDFDFLNELTQEPTPEASSVDVPAASNFDTLGVSDKDRDDSFAWLENLAAKQGASEGLLTRPEDRLQEEPEWVKQAKGISSEPPVSQSPVATPSVNAEELGKSDQERDDSFAWLENLAAKQGASEGLLTRPEDRLQEEPEWVKQAKDNASQQPPVAQTPVMPPAANAEDLGKSEQERDDSFAWLENLAAKQGASEGLLTKPEDRLEQEPEWVKQAKDNASQQPPVSEAPVPTPPTVNAEELGKSEQERDDSFSWLESLAAKQGASEGLLTRPEDRLQEEPEWVKQAKDSDAQQPPALQTPSLAEDLGKSDQERDDSFSWLESLAANQGASEGLLTKPEDRLQEEPEWVKQARDSASQPPPEVSQPPVIPPSSSVEELGKSEQERDDSFAWLENLAAKQGASEGLLTKPEERLQEEPEWVKQAKELSAQQPSAPVSEQPDDTEAWLKDLAEKESAPEMPAKMLDVDIPAWMNNMERDEIPAAEAPIPASAADDQSDWIGALESPAPVEAEKSRDDELPNWLSELDQEEKQIATSTDHDDLPEWLRGEDVAPAQTPEPTRTTDWRPAEAKQPEPEPAYTPPSAEEKQPKPELVYSPPIMEEKLPEPELAKPLPPVSFDMPEEQPQAVRQQQEAEPEQPPAFTPPHVEAVTRRGTDPMLGIARNELSRSNIPGALESYGKLIKKARYLDEVIHDLREALYRYPVDVSIWQSLGDAYMRANRLQDALDAYTKAEELLR